MIPISRDKVRRYNKINQITYVLVKTYSRTAQSNWDLITAHIALYQTVVGQTMTSKICSLIVLLSTIVETNIKNSFFHSCLLVLTFH